jgi:hypothetical protein
MIACRVISKSSRTGATAPSGWLANQSPAACDELKKLPRLQISARTLRIATIDATTSLRLKRSSVGFPLSSAINEGNHWPQLPVDAGVILLPLALLLLAEFPGPLIRTALLLQRQRAELAARIAAAQASLDMIDAALTCDHEDFTRCPHFRETIRDRVAGKGKSLMP